MDPSIGGIQPILSADGRLSEPAVQYIPALNRYLLFEWYYPNNIQSSSANSANSQWITYEAPHPWGPWKLIDSRNWPAQGYYNPVPLQRSALNGTTLTLMSTGNFNADWSAYPICRLLSHTRCTHPQSKSSPTPRLIHRLFQILHFLVFLICPEFRGRLRLTLCAGSPVATVEVLFGWFAGQTEHRPTLASRQLATST